MHPYSDDLYRAVGLLFAAQANRTIHPLKPKTMANTSKQPAFVHIQQQPEVIAGIDLGTTNSLVAIIHPSFGQPVALREYNNSALVPSVLYFTEEESVVVGNKAKAALITHPRQTVYSAKRLMGRSYNDVKEQEAFFSYRLVNDETDSLLKVQVADKDYTPVELSAYLLSALKRRAEYILQTSINKAVITVPASFNDAQRQATRDAGKLAGLDVLRIINEPTAAALAYGMGLQRNEEKTVAVYDLGGGIFDLSILKIANGVFEVLATSGDTTLGGDDMDQAIVEHWAWLHEIEPEALGSNKGLGQALRLKAAEAKQQLSGADYFHTRMDNYELQLTQAQLEELVQPLIAKTIDCCRKALTDAQLTVKDINAVLMVGGATRMPLVKEAVSGFFEQPVNDSLHPDEVVALGAAIQADMLAGNRHAMQLQDVTPLSLGIETMGGLMDVLIPRNTKIPASAFRNYTTQQDGQTSMKVAIYQGERDQVKDNRKLAEFELTGIPEMNAGLAQIQLSFSLNEDGILLVKARELRSGVEQSIQVQPQYGLTGQEVNTMLQSSIRHAQEDLQTRNVLEIQTTAQQLLDVTAAFLDKNTELLSGEEIQNTRQAMNDLQDVIATNDKAVIEEKIAALNELSKPYAERLTDKAARADLKQHIEE